MKIEDFNIQTVSGRRRATATIKWEDRQREPLTVFFEVADRFSQRLACNPHAFLTACALPALRHGEQRIYIDAGICPKLKNNLIEAMRLVRLWYGRSLELVKIPRIEARAVSSFVPNEQAARAGLFLSGGLDSIATLRANRLTIPMDHSASFVDAIVVQGFDYRWRDQMFTDLIEQLQVIAGETKINLIPIHTNVRSIDDDSHFFVEQYQSAVLASVAHAANTRLNDMTIPPDDNIPYKRGDITPTGRVFGWPTEVFFVPYGSHPLLDPLYSSCDMNIHQDGFTFSRYDRTQLIANWSIGLQNLRVCPKNWPGPNCGECEKCMRTMLGLVAARALKKTKAFPTHDVTADMVKEACWLPAYRIEIGNPNHQYYELLSPLQELGRSDLVSAIEYVMARADRADWRGALTRLDRRLLGGSLRRYYLRLKNKMRSPPAEDARPR